jgi:hypothetical protein
VATGNKWRCRSLRTFFGLGDEYIQGVYDEIFTLKYFGGWSFTEAYSLPIKIRRWFIHRLGQQLESEKEQIDKAKSKKR